MNPRLIVCVTCLFSLAATGFTQQPAEHFADPDELVEMFGMPPGIGVGDHRDGGGLARRRRDVLAHLAMRLLDLDDQLADPRVHCRPPLR